MQNNEHNRCPLHLITAATIPCKMKYLTVLLYRTETSIRELQRLAS